MRLLPHAPSPPAWLILAVLSSLAVACSETHAGIVSSYLPKTEALVAKWARLGGSVDAIRYGDATRPLPVPLPELVLSLASPQAANAEAVPVECLADPSCESIPFDLLLSPTALDTLRWTGQLHRLDEDERSDADAMRSTIETALGLRYLVAYERREWRQPYPHLENAASPVRVGFRGYVLDLEAERVTTVFDVEPVESALGDEPPEELWHRARAAFAAQLEAVTGGDVIL